VTVVLLHAATLLPLLLLLLLLPAVTVVWLDYVRACPTRHRAGRCERCSMRSPMVIRVELGAACP
jgi:hypothetical protein